MTLLSGRARPYSIVPFPWPCFQDYKYKTERIMHSTIHIAKLQRVQNGANGAGYTIQLIAFIGSHSVTAMHQCKTNSS